MPQFVAFWKVFRDAELDSNDFAYVLLPFLGIFKLFGFAPVKCVWRAAAAVDKASPRNGGEGRSQARQLRHCERVLWDAWALAWTALGAVVYCVGFGLGVKHLGRTRNWSKLYDTSVVTFFTSWAQIMTLFLLGAFASVTAWTRMRDLRRLCGLIGRIDALLNAIADLAVDYGPLRRKLYAQLVVSVVLPLLSSMVNCVVIERHEAAMLEWSGSCFWFICFAPLLLLGLKEFQFFSLMFVLRTKCALVNRKLRFLACGVYRARILHLEQGQERRQRLTSSSEMPLTAVAISTVCQEEPARVDSSVGGDEAEDLPATANEDLSVSTLQRLFEAYSLIADAVELTLRIFAWHLLLITSTSIGVITIQSYNLFMLIAHSIDMAPQQVFFIVLWIVVQIVAVGVNVSACSMTAAAMSRTGPLLHKIKVPAGAEQGLVFYQLLQLFSLEVLQRRNNFTAAGFFDINYKLITSIIAAVTTYLVIIIQFHLANIPAVHYKAAPLV